MSDEEAWVTLATNDSYALGALVVSRSLKRVNTTRKLVVMITPGVSGPMRNALSSEFNTVYDVNVLDSQDAANLALLTRPELGITFTKLHCWKLVQFSKCVFLDADTLILQNCDELFEREEFSAAPDVGWPDCFNSGVFVFKPSNDTFDKLLAFAVARGSFDGGDQGLLNLYFNDWSVTDIGRHLPFIYNMVASATYSYLPAFKVFGPNVKIVHFIGPEKPWLMYFDSSTGSVRPPYGQEHLHDLLQSWWDIFRSDVHSKLSPDMGGEGHGHTSATLAEQAGLAGAFAKMSLEGSKSEQQIEFEEQMRKHAWESGHIDYLGKDSFDNIMKKIHASIAQTSAPTVTPPTETAPEPTTATSQPETAPTPQPIPQTEAVPTPQPETTPITQTEAAPIPKTEAVPTPPTEAVPTPKTETVPTPKTETAPIPPTEAVPTQQPEATPIPQTEAAPIPPPETAAKPPTEAIPIPKTETVSIPPTEAVPTPQPEATPKPQTETAPIPPTEAEPSTEQLDDDARLAEERLVIEKKLAEQKRIAEQKLIEEKQAAEARAAAAAANAQQVATSAEASASEAAAPPPKPVAPPRRQSKEEEQRHWDWRLWRNNVGYRMSLGMGLIAVVVYAIYNASTSPIRQS